MNHLSFLSIGLKAPVDLAGSTPLGSACHRKKGVAPEIATLLFSPGDKTILPKTPHSKRVGKSPWKHSHRPDEELIYAHSEAQGWSKQMEDRIMISCPVSGRIAWSLFAVFDGHGGSFCSQYLSSKFSEIFSAAADEILGGNGQALQESLEDIQKVLYVACERAENSLKSQQKLKITKVGERYRCRDNSGSTGVICLVTQQYIIVANVGDSRSILCCSAPGISSDGSESVTKAMSSDHKFSIPAERRRAIAAGGK